MGKNQAYKAMQRSRVGSTSAQPDEVEDGMSDMLLVWLVSTLPTPSPGKTIRTSKSIILPQSPHLVAMKTNQEDQDQVLKDQRRRRSTSPAETNALLKVKTKPMALVPLSRFFGNLKS
ncbi:uncharacterized protein LOC106365083 isoform X3 [Brassica napus]|uniref:(rape) hypothetical protein n=1 Tax=Brassica napus TaxID=3708 RepID=A0A816PG15_BRANA|nr:uncharacterized protein LOC106365083 isoform X3 [Brassica napus]CAF2048663.1 unnamed protein product [Brassica napus]